MLLGSHLAIKSIDGDFGAPLNVQVTGTNPSGTTTGGVPSTGVSAVVLNVTATNPSTASYLTAWPTGATQPTASNLNFTTGETVPNRVIVPVSSSGQVSIYNGHGTSDVVVDVSGWFTDGSSLSQTGDVFTARSPQRVCDTRPSGVSGVTDQCTGHTIGAGATLGVAIVGQGTVPTTGVVAAVLNATAVGQTAAGFFTVWPTGSTRGTICTGPGWGSRPEKGGEDWDHEAPVLRQIHPAPAKV